MKDYPEIRAVGASIEVELEQGVTIVAYIGDTGVASQIEELWSMRHSLVATAARVSRQLSQIDRQRSPDRDLRDALADLRRQIDVLEATYGVQCE